MTTTPAAGPGNEHAASAVPGTGTARVSRKPGWWSVGLALGSAVVFWIIGAIVAVAIMAIFGGMGDPDSQAVGGVVAPVIYVLVVAMVIAAMILGVTSIVRAFTQVGHAGRTTAIVLGGIGIVFSTVMGWVLLLPFV